MFDVMTVLSGAGAGVAYALSVYSKKEGQPWDWQKFLVTVGFGAVVGIGGVVYDLPLDRAYEFGVQIGAVVVVENLLKAAKRKLLPLVWKKG